MEDVSGAEIKAICTEAGYFAIRGKRTKVTQKDFLRAVEKIKNDKEVEGKEFKQMFG